MECTKSNEKLQIMYDELCESPRDLDNMTVIATIKQRNHEIGDIQFNDSDELMEYIKEQKAIYQMPLFIYEHSGISLKCFENDPSYPYNDQWDAGCIGVVFTTKETLKNYGFTATKTGKEGIIENMKNEVETYSQWCNGECYGYRLLKWSQCKSCDQEVDQEVDSCYGFYGYDFEKNGLYDAVLDSSKVFKSHKEIEELIQ